MINEVKKFIIPIESRPRWWQFGKKKALRNRIKSYTDELKRAVDDLTYFKETYTMK